MPPSPRPARPGRRRQPVAVYVLVRVRREGSEALGRRSSPIPRSRMPNMVPPSLVSAGGRKRNRRSGTHPRRSSLGVVHERQSVPDVEAFRAGEGVAPDHRETHGRRPGRGASGVNDETRREFTVKLSSEIGVRGPASDSTNRGGPITFVSLRGHILLPRIGESSGFGVCQRGFRLSDPRSRRRSGGVDDKRDGRGRR